MDDTSDWWRLSGASCVHNSAEWQQPSSGGFFRREKAPKEQEKYHTNWTRKSPKKQRFSWPSTAFNSFPTAESHCFYKRHWRRSSRFTSWPFHSIHSFIHSSSTNSINLKRTICLRTVTIQPKLSEPMVEINRCSYIIDTHQSSSTIASVPIQTCFDGHLMTLLKHHQRLEIDYSTAEDMEIIHKCKPEEDNFNKRFTKRKKKENNNR